MDAAARADQLQAELLKSGAVEGVVGCHVSLATYTSGLRRAFSSALVAAKSLR